MLLGTKNAKKWSLIGVMTLFLLLNSLGLSCGIGGNKEPVLTPVDTAMPTLAATRRKPTPRPVATFPVLTPTLAPSPTPPPGTEGTSWQIAAISVEGGDCNDLAFNPDASVLAIAARDKFVRLMDPVTSAVVRTLVGHTGAVNQVAFAPSGSWLLSAADDGTLVRWDAASGARLVVLGDSTSGKVTSLDISPNEELIASSSGVGVVNVWNATTSALNFKLTDHLAPISGLSFSPTGAQVASSALNGIIVLAPVNGSPGEEFARDPDPVQDVIYTDANHLVTANKSGVWVWDLTSGAALVLEPVPSVGAVDKLAISSDGALLAALARDGTVWVWNLADLSLRAAIPSGGGRLLSLAFSPICDACPTAPGWMLAIGGEDGRVWLWGIRNKPSG